MSPYDAYGKLSLKGESNYLYDPQHPHAVQSALGWGYTYNQNGDVVTRMKGQDSYTFTYTDFLKVETISRGVQVLHRYGYDASGKRVSERRSDGTLVFFVGEYYEYSVLGTETHERKYYGREAMRLDGVLYFILTDHLGSTSVVTDDGGNNPFYLGYDAWGATRYTHGTILTDKLYTGQRLSGDLGLYDYKARWYDPIVGRFLMEDPIIPSQGVQKLDRYAGMMNNPIFFVDPSGNEVCDEDGNCYDHGSPTKVVRIFDPVKYVGMKEDDVRILTVLTALKSSSGNVPDYVNYQKAWALLSLRSYNRYYGNHRDPVLQNWRNHESELLNKMGIIGTLDQQEVDLLSLYIKYARGNEPGMSIEDFQAIEAQVRKAALASFTYGWNSSADPVHGATGFRDADGYYYPSGKKDHHS